MRHLQAVVSGRPQLGEFADYAQDDIDYVAGDDAVAALERQRDEVLALLGTLDDERIAGLTYAPAKWTLKEVIGHLCDDERIFAYRLLCVARGDVRPLPGFDENEYMRDAGFESRTLADLAAEYAAVRAATLSLLGSMTAEGWRRRGVVNGYEASVRGLAFHVAGHELHHLRILRDKYLP
jgi:uncharacterized damage-inducible protein DinB